MDRRSAPAFISAASRLPARLTSDLASHAARAALEHAKVDAKDIDLIVLGTSTPDNTFPATAVSVQAGLGITQGAAFDIQAVCSGFVYGLSIADALLRSGAHKRALLIGAETFSRILDWTDRDDLRPVRRRRRRGGDRSAGAAGRDVRSRRARPRICAPTASTRTSSMSMAARHRRRPSATCAWIGNEVFRHAVAMITDVVEDAFEATGATAQSHRLVRAASGQQAHHRRLGAQARHRRRQGGHHRRPARQHVGRLDPAGALRRGIATGASRRATSSCSRPWAGASPGARRWCGCRGPGSGCRLAERQNFVIVKPVDRIFSSTYRKLGW